MGSWTNVAALLRAKTNEGGLSVKATESLPFLLEEGMEVTFVPPVLRIPRSGRVSAVEETGEGRYMVWFDCISNRTDAEKLEGHFCLVRTDCLPEGFDQQHGLDIVGFTIATSEGVRIGTVVDIEENPMQSLLVVKREPAEVSVSAETGEVLIPLVDEFIESIDEEACTICVSLPDGLLDL